MIYVYSYHDLYSLVENNKQKHGAIPFKNMWVINHLGGQLGTDQLGELRTHQVEVSKATKVAAPTKAEANPSW